MLHLERFYKLSKLQSRRAAINAQSIIPNATKNRYIPELEDISDNESVLDIVEEIDEIEVFDQEDSNNDDDNNDQDSVSDQRMHDAGADSDELYDHFYGHNNDSDAENVNKSTDHNVNVDENMTD